MGHTCTLFVFPFDSIFNWNKGHYTVLSLLLFKVLHIFLRVHEILSSGILLVKEHFYVVALIFYSIDTLF